MTCDVVTADDSSGVSAGGGRARAERWKFFTLTIACHEGHRPPMTSSPMAAARCQHLLDLPAQVPDPRKKRGRRHALAGLLAVGIAAVIAGSKSFAAIGQWAGDAGPDVLAALGAERGPAEESTYRRAFALVSADVLDRVLGAWLHTRAVRAGGRLVIAIDGKTVRGAKSKGGRAPHLVAALAHGIGAVLGQVAVDEKSNEIPAVRELLKAFADVAGAVFTIDAMHTQTDTAKVILARRADYVMTVKKNQRAHLVHAAQEASLGRNPRRLLRGQGPRPPGPPHHQGGARAGLDRVRRRRPGRAAAPHRHAEREEDRRGRLPDHQRQDVDPATLAAWVRSHWKIENCLHWVRDVTYLEDKSLVRTGNAPRVMASLRSLAISLLRLDGQDNIAAANRHHLRDPQRTLKLLQAA